MPRYTRKTLRRQPRRRLNPFAATAAHLAIQGARAAAARYGTRVAAGAAASGAAYAGYRATRRTGRKTGPTVTRLTPRKRPRTNFDGGAAAQGGYVQEERRRLTTGRKEKKSQIVKSLATRDLLSRTLFWKVLPTQFTGTFGMLQLSNNNSDAQKTWLPLYLFDLTHLQAGGVSKGVCHRANIGTGTSPGVVNWASVSGQDAGAGTTNNMGILRQSPDFPSTPQPVIHYGTAHVNLVLYGNTTKNTVFNVALVQFTDEENAPFDDLAGGESGNPKHNAFWQERVRRYITHPCEQSVKYRQSGMKVLRSRTFKIAPSSSTELDTNPHHLIVKWKHHINKQVGMRLTGTATMNASQISNAQYNVTDAAGGAGILTDTPRVKDRVYLLVEANDWIASGTDDNSKCASFDVALTCTHYVTV